MRKMLANPKTAEELFNNGLIHLNSNQHDRSRRNFIYCLKLDVNYFNKILDILFMAIIFQERDKINTLLRALRQVPDNGYKADCLLIISVLKFKELLDKNNLFIAKDIDFSKVKLADDDKRYENIPLHNELRKCIVSYDYKQACELLRKITREQPKRSKIISFLVNNLYDIYYGMAVKEVKISKIIEEKRYRELIEYLSSITNRASALVYYDYLLKLARTIQSIKMTKKIPNVTAENCVNLYDAIDNNNYQQALNFLQKENLTTQESLILYLLQEVIELIARFKPKEIAPHEYIDCVIAIKEPLIDDDGEVYLNEPEFNSIISMTEEDFNLDLEDGISNIIELMNEGESFEGAMITLGLLPEERLITMLKFASLCYGEENRKMGDYYLKKVEMTKNKSETVKTLLEEVKINKKFYPNRKSKGQSLTRKVIR